MKGACISALRHAAGVARLLIAVVITLCFSGCVAEPKVAGAPVPPKISALHPEFKTTHDLVQYYEGRVSTIGRVISSALKEPPPDIDVEIDPENQEHFGFYHNAWDAGQTRRITLGLQGLKAMHYVAYATAIADTLSSPNRYQWPVLYMLYMRRTGDWATLLDPFQILRRTDPQFVTEVSREAIKFFDAMLTFILAHELGHAVLDHRPCGADLMLEACTKKIRDDEGAADQFAVQVLWADRIFQGGLPGASGAALVFNVWTVIDGRAEINRESHPASVDRARRLVDYLLSHINDVKPPIETSRDEFERNARSFRNALSTFLADAPKYFDMLNRRAATVDISQLSSAAFK